MKKHGMVAIAVALIFVTAFSFIACDAAQGVAEHTHSFVFDSSNGSITCSACREYVAPSTYLARVEGSTVKGIVGLDSSNEGYGLTVSGGNIKIANSESVTFVVKTSGQDLTVDAENATVYHYGSAGSVNIMAVANHSYHGKSSIDNTLTVSKGNIELAVDVPTLNVNATGAVSIKSEKTINSLVASSTSTSFISVSSKGTIKDVKADAPLSLEGTGKVENIAATKPLTIALPVDNVEIKSAEVNITLGEGATKVSITVDEESVGTSFELVLKGTITEDMKVDVEGAGSVSTPDSTTHIHNWKETGRTKATCTDAGQIDYICATEGCSETSQKAIAALGHDLKHHDAQNPTCTETGWKAYDTCARCTHTTYEEVAALGHSWDNGVVTKEATETEKGIKTLTCAACKTTKTETIPITGSKSIPLCFTSEEDGSSVSLKKYGSPSITSMKTSTDGQTWTDYIFGDTITLAKAGDKVYFMGEYGALYNSYYLYFTMTGKIASSGNIMSLCKGSSFGSAESVEYSQFHQLFKQCTSLTTAPELPATTLEEDCYYEMFYNCVKLKITTSNTTGKNSFFKCPSTIPKWAVNRMFYGTGGSFTGTPTAGTTHYWY